MIHAYSPESIDTRSSIGPLIHRLRIELSLAIEQALAREPTLAEYQLTAAQFVVLSNLYDGEARTAGELCKLMGYDSGAMSRMLDRLKKRRLIHRRRRHDDRRAVTIELAPGGFEVVPTMRASVVNVLSRFLKGFTRPEISQIEALLQRMLANRRFFTS